MDIKEFCEIVEEDLLFLLYKKHDEFPGDCQTVSNLVNSYLSVHFDEIMVHRKIKTVNGTHGWIENNEIEIDFMNFQFELTDKERAKIRESSKSMTADELISIVKRCRTKYPLIAKKIVDHSNEGDICELFGVKFAQKVKNPYNKVEFLNYVKNALESVDKLVIENGLYD